METIKKELRHMLNHPRVSGAMIIQKAVDQDRIQLAQKANLGAARAVSTKNKSDEDCLSQIVLDDPKTVQKSLFFDGVEFVFESYTNNRFVFQSTEGQKLIAALAIQVVHCGLLEQKNPTTTVKKAIQLPIAKKMLSSIDQISEQVLNFNEKNFTYKSASNLAYQFEVDTFKIELLTKQTFYALQFNKAESMSQCADAFESLFSKFFDVPRTENILKSKTQLSSPTTIAEFEFNDKLRIGFKGEVFKYVQKTEEKKAEQISCLCVIDSKAVDYQLKLQKVNAMMKKFTGVYFVTVTVGAEINVGAYYSKLNIVEQNDEFFTKCLMESENEEKEAKLTKFYLFNAMSQLIQQEADYTKIQAHICTELQISQPAEIQEDNLLVFKSADKCTFQGIEVNLIHKPGQLKQRNGKALIFLNSKGSKFQETLTQLDEMRTKTAAQLILIVSNVMSINLQQTMQKYPQLKNFFVGEELFIFKKTCQIYNMNKAVLYFAFDYYDCMVTQNTVLTNLVEDLDKIKQDYEHKEQYYNQALPAKVNESDSQFLDFNGQQISIIHQSNKLISKLTFVAFFDIDTPLFSTQFSTFVKLALKFKEVHTVLCVKTQTQQTINTFLQKWQHARNFTFVKGDEQFFKFVQESSQLQELNDLPDEDREQKISEMGSFYATLDALNRIEQQGIDCEVGFNLYVQIKNLFNPFDVPRKVFEQHQIDLRGDDCILFSQGVRYLQKIEKYQTSQMICCVKLKEQNVQAQLEAIIKLMDIKQMYVLCFFENVKEELYFAELCLKYKLLKKLNVCVHTDLFEFGLFFQSFRAPEQPFKDLSELSSTLDQAQQRFMDLLNETQDELSAESPVEQKIHFDPLIFRGSQLTYAQLTRKGDFSWFCVCYIDARAADFEHKMFELYKLQEENKDLFVGLVLYGLKEKNLVALVQKKFSFAQKLNLLNYRKGLNKRLHLLFEFTDQLLVLYADSQEQLLTATDSAQITEYIQIEEKPSTIPDIVIAQSYASFRGEILRFKNKSTKSKNIVICNNTELDCSANVRAFYNQSVKVANGAKTDFAFVVIVPNDQSKLVKVQADLKALVVCEDSEGVMGRVLSRYNASQGDNVVVIQDGAFKCCCGIDQIVDRI
ncbi:Conserved_hypothetical protein [Hexamita inflata]|uniref:Uncharacterized protein n=1 Tax=Hexamita inflata TaxID=28002 RepID=A0AA86P6S8_9EUKA|nr:Conserved hypothetical protein [Hexamita inflata]